MKYRIVKHVLYSRAYLEVLKDDTWRYLTFLEDEEDLKEQALAYIEKLKNTITNHNNGVRSMKISEETRQTMLAVWEECDEDDKSTEYLCARLMDCSGLDYDEVIEFMINEG